MNPNFFFLPTMVNNNNNGDDSGNEFNRKRKVSLEYTLINNEEEDEEVEIGGGSEGSLMNQESETIQSNHEEDEDEDDDDLLELKLSSLPSDSKSKSREIRPQPPQYPPISLSSPSLSLSSTPSPSQLSPPPFPFQPSFLQGQYPQQFSVFMHHQHWNLPVSPPLPNFNMNINTNIQNPYQPPPMQQQPNHLRLGSPNIPMARHRADVPPVAIRQTRARRNPSQSPREGKGPTILPPFPWATNLRATVHNLHYLTDTLGISTVTGDVQCKKCERQYEIVFNLPEKFRSVANFIADNRYEMHERAPAVWMNPHLPTCRHCNSDNMAKPVIAQKKKNINWLFLLLGQMLGCLTLEQLKYFCKHTKNHRTGAKDRVLYLTYLGLCKQLMPAGPFDR